MVPEGAARQRLIRGRGAVVLAILLAGFLAFLALGLAPGDLVPRGAGLEIALSFFSAALSPDLSSTTLGTMVEAVVVTIVVAACAMSLALVLGVVLGFFASTAWWADDPVGGRGALRRVLGATVLPVVYGGTRVLIAVLRSIHELMWALLFLHAIGLNTLAAIVAIALPYGGTLAKVFSEMIDESPRDTAVALQGAGASSLQVFSFGLVPRALPDMAAYAFYRFECALRSSAILGFFGIATLGYYIGPEFENSHYGTTWTYLYALFALVLVVDVWSGRLRRTVVA